MDADGANGAGGTGAASGQRVQGRRIRRQANVNPLWTPPSFIEQLLEMPASDRVALARLVLVAHAISLGGGPVVIDDGHSVVAVGVGTHGDGIRRILGREP